MKKILFSLMALVCCMSMNAQVMKVYKGNEAVATYIGGDYKVVLEELINVSSITLNNATAELTLGGTDAQKTTTLTATVAPENATDKTVTWSSSDQTVATVDAEGIVTAVKAGSATITATANDGSCKTATCTVTVKQLVTSFTLDKTTAEVEKGGTVTLTATVNPEDASNKEIQWASSDDTKATVSAEGVVTGVAEGTVTITATAKDGSGVSATCTIIVLPPVPEIDPLTLTALEDGSKVSIYFEDFQYKTSTMADWEDYVENTDIELDNGQYVQFRGKPGSTHTNVYGSFKMSGSFNASGNIMSLLNGREMGSNAFSYLFQNCTSLKDASALLLPATTLTKRCYSFMFQGCISLVNAPELPATELAENCYYVMFQGCTSLVNAPALPATTLAEDCYASMFEDCTSLVNAPALPATELPKFCYYSMFARCTSLKSIKVNFTDWHTENRATAYWVEDVPAGGTFTCPNGLPDEKDVSKIPTGWTVVRK